jgi:hypothetical protein
MKLRHCKKLTIVLIESHRKFHPTFSQSGKALHQSPALLKSIKQVCKLTKDSAHGRGGVAVTAGGKITKRSIKSVIFTLFSATRIRSGREPGNEANIFFQIWETRMCAFDALGVHPPPEKGYGTALAGKNFRHKPRRGSRNELAKTEDLRWQTGFGLACP